MSLVECRTSRWLYLVEKAERTPVDFALIVGVVQRNVYDELATPLGEDH